MRSLPSFLVLVLLGLGPAAVSGARTELGTKIPDVQLASTAGSKSPIAGNATANVVVFFRPDQKAMAATLKGLANCEQELAGKPVRWVAVVPSRFTVEEAKAAADAAGMKMPVLIDQDDSVQTLLGVAVHPTVAILDKEHRLVQFQPFVKLNFCESVMARIQFVLGDLDQAGLARALDPSAAQPTGGTSQAGRDVKLAEMLLKSGNVEKALEIARQAVKNDPKSAAAQAVLGKALAQSGDCGGAVAAYDAALRLDSKDAQAKAGKLACAGKR